MRRLFLALLVVACFSTVGNAQQQAGDPLLAKMESLLLALGQENLHERAWAGRQLALLGEKSIPFLLERYSGSNFVVRREITTIFGMMRTNQAQEILLSTCMRDKDAGVRSRACLALLHRVEEDPKVWEKARKYRDEIKKKAVENASFELEILRDLNVLIESIVYCTIEKALANILSPGGGWGFYEGQFNHLLYLEEDAVPVLLDLFRSKKYLFVTREYQDNQEIQYKMRALAGYALAEFQPYMKKTRPQVVSELTNFVRFSHLSQEADLKDVAICSLYLLGEKREFQNRVRNLERNVRGGYANACSDLAMLYLRVREEHKAVDLLKKARDLDSSNSIYDYNLACAYAVLNKVEEGLSALESAVAKGYEDYGWIERDGDLKNLRGTARYKKLVEDLKARKKQ